MMRRLWTVSCLALAMAFVTAHDAAAKTGASAKGTAATAKANAAFRRGATRAPGHVRVRVAYAPESYGVARGRRSVFTDLVGDPDSGYGFYPLPPEIQGGAARYRAVHRRFWWQNPVLSAMAADAIRTPCYVPAASAYRCGVFNPIEGVGTPFFAGYYR